MQRVLWQWAFPSASGFRVGCSTCRGCSAVGGRMGCRPTALGCKDKGSIAAHRLPFHGHTRRSPLHSLGCRSLWISHSTCNGRWLALWPVASLGILEPSLATCCSTATARQASFWRTSIGLPKALGGWHPAGCSPRGACACRPLPRTTSRSSISPTVPTSRTQSAPVSAA